MLLFVKRLIAFYKSQPVFHRRRFFHGKAIQGSEAPDIAWLEPSGQEMSADAWKNANVRCLGVQLFGENVDVDSHGESIHGDMILILFNADHATTISFRLPQPGTGNETAKGKSSKPGKAWLLEFDAACKLEDCPSAVSESYDLKPCSLVVLRYPSDHPQEMVDVRAGSPIMESRN